jgi:uroporphyrinogen-III synthase
VREPFLAALRRSRVVVRGPKPMTALRELAVPVWLAVPEPNTWRELLASLDAKASERPLAGARVAVQEYGVSNAELVDGLRGRGAQVTRVPVYRWALPEDIEPLKAAVRAVARGELDVVMFTTSMQVVHLLRVAADMHLGDAVMQGLSRMMIASIGPTTSEELTRHGLAADLEPSHPKMGLLVREAAERAADVLRAKRPAV